MLWGSPRGGPGLPWTNKFCSSVGIAGSGFPFDFGRAPYKGRRPLRDMLGSHKSRHGSGDPAPPEGTSGSVARPASDAQLQVQSQQEELERLQKDLCSQKVTAPHTPPPTSRRSLDPPAATGPGHGFRGTSLARERGPLAWPEDGVVCTPSSPALGFTPEPRNSN